MMTADDAAKVYRVSPRRVYRLIEDKQTHFQVTCEGVLLVCPESLSAAIEAEELHEKIVN